MFIFSQHTLQKIDALGIDKNDIISVITRGMKWKEKDSEKWHAKAFGIEAVFIKRNSDIFIITVYQQS